ncbi:MAG: Gldg family protein [Cyanobacteriota bacterium]
MKKNNYLILFFGIFLIFSGFASFFIQGKADLASIIMLISGFLITIIFIMLNSKDLLSLLLKRDVKYGANSLLMTIIFIAILVFVQIIVVDKKIQFDFTSEKIFTLSEQSTKVLNNLKNPIKVMAFTNKATEIKINDILEIYRIKSKMFSYETIDPSTNPIKAKEYNIQVNNTLIFFNGDKK